MHFTTKLFGDDVSKKVTDISDANKVSRRCLDHNVSRRRDMMPFRGRGSSRGRQPRYQPYPDRPFFRQRSIERQPTTSIPRQEYDDPPIKGGVSQCPLEQSYFSFSSTGAMGGRIKNYYENWKKITSDRFILSIGLRL